MFRRLFRRIKWWRAERPIRAKNYHKAFQRYRRQHPESMEEERKQIQQWISHVHAGRRAEQQGNTEFPTTIKENQLAEALYQMREVARAAFMSHPAATEGDFRRCWPSIREEMLKQHALEELAANPALSESLAREASAANGEALQCFDGSTLHLLK